MHNVSLMGFALTVITFVAACGSSDERVTVGTSAGTGGAAGQAGQDAGVDMGEQGASPHIAPTWVKILPDIDAVDLAADTTNHLLFVGYGGADASTYACRNDGMAMVALASLPSGRNSACARPKVRLWNCVPSCAAESSVPRG
ncbi:MAG: hypothetical protein IPM54_28185 [Polyangiaceae bacterium]|nr:hypothetical protein [Polyangiaceae bacterium]